MTSRSVNAGRALAPHLSRLLMRGRFAKLISLSESYLAYIQGKGSGTGWDIQDEASVAASYIHRQDPILFDVGAHHGKWSAEVLRLMGSDNKCQVFQFEPLKYNQEKLRSLDLPRATIIEAAVSDKPGKATFWAPDAWSPVASLYKRRDSQLQQYDFAPEEVIVVTIDEIIERFDIEAVDFMKLDVEGSELAVLHGSRKALQSKRITSMTFAFGAGNINSRTFFHDFWDLLTAYDYRIKRICPGGDLLDITAYYEDLEYFRGVSNYLATLL
jgi:FkbM family methyltransferase